MPFFTLIHFFTGTATVWYGLMLHHEGLLSFSLDKDGVAVIICETRLENKYRSLVQGTTVLESSLHTNLTEHLNSEVGLGTITSVNSAKEWLRSSFLFQRIRKNPDHYALGNLEANQTWQDRVDNVVIQSVQKLKDSQLLRDGDHPGDLMSTEFGDIMSKVRSTRDLIFLPSKISKKLVLHSSVNSEFFLIVLAYYSAQYWNADVSDPCTPRTANN